MTPGRVLRDRAWLWVVMGTVAFSTALSREANAQRRRIASDASGYASRIDTTFAFSRSGTVTLTAHSGDIIVTGWSHDEIHVRATSDDDNLRFTGSSSRVSIDVGGSHRGSDTRFEVTVPYGVRVTTNTQSGDISVHGTRGQLEVHSNNGDVDIDDIATRLDISTLSGDIVGHAIAGDVSISAISGEVRLSDVRGNIDVGTVSGDIGLRSVAAKIVRAKTTSGEIVYDGTIDATGRYDLSSHSGDVKLRVPRDASAQLTVSTWNGTIDSDFPITLKPGEQRISASRSKRYVFDINGGGARISAETFSGDITIASNGRGPTGARP